MKKFFSLLLGCIMALLLASCSSGAAKQWDCSVKAAEAVVYSDQKIVSEKGTLSFQNRNDFDMVVYLKAEDQQERTAQIPAGGVAALHQVSGGTEYTVGCTAQVAPGTQILCVVYDGETTDVYTK
jgi:hypothetical protein